MKIYFLTYSKDDCTRLKYRAIESGWFDKVFTLLNNDKLLPEIILNTLNKINEHDILVYASEFSEINLNGYNVFNNNIEYLQNEYSIILYGSYVNNKLKADENVIILEKNSKTIDFINEWIKSNDFNSTIEKNKDVIKMLSPDMNRLYSSTFETNAEVRLSNNDILPNCKNHYYKPYSMFVAGHVLPHYEIDYDAYTHFINVGTENLHRCNANTKCNIKECQDLAELTALFWIWKNIDISDLKYIGFSTYRKPFLSSNEEMFRILESGKADCIANRCYFNFRNIHQIELGKENIDEFERITKIAMNKDDYAEFIDDYRNSKFIYICNSFVISTEKFKQLCEKIFNTMILVSNKMNGKSGIKDHRPCAGCFAECVTSFYLKKLFKNIYTVPFLIHPLYKQLCEDKLESKDPMIFGTLIDGSGRTLFFPQGEHPTTENKVNREIKSEFYSDADRKKLKKINIFQTRCYLI